MNLGRLARWASALLLIGVGAGGAGMGMVARSAPPEPQRAAFAVPAEKRYRVKMAGGATFEVVAVASHFPSGPKTWWRPDGIRLDEAPADPSQRVPFGKPGEVLLDILVRVDDLPMDSTLKWVPTYDEECISYSGSVAKDGRLVPELRAYIVSVRPARPTGSVRIQFAAGPWKTEGSNRGGRGYTGVTVMKDGHQFCFSTARPYRGGTTITVAHNLVEVNLHLRLVAVDRQGKEHEPSYYADSDAGTSHSFVNHMGREHPANYSSGDGGEFFKMLDTEFSLPPDQIQECRVQSRPFERAEIKDIALHPRLAGE